MSLRCSHYFTVHLTTVSIWSLLCWIITVSGIGHIVVICYILYACIKLVKIATAAGLTYSCRSLTIVVIKSSLNSPCLNQNQLYNWPSIWLLLLARVPIQQVTDHMLSINTYAPHFVIQSLVLMRRLHWLGFWGRGRGRSAFSMDTDLATLLPAEHGHCLLAL